MIDESPDLMGRPVLNILASFFNYETRQKRTVLLKTTIMISTNSVFISHNLSQVLGDFNKSYEDVIANCSDSAEYMKKLMAEIRIWFNNKLYHIDSICRI